MEWSSFFPLPESLAYLLLLIVVIPATLYLSAKPFIQEIIAQAFYIIIVEKIFPPHDFPRVGAHAAGDVSDAKWLSQALSIKFPGTVVRSASATSMGADMGNASTMFRLGIAYGKNPHDLPATMIAKLLKPDLKNRLPFTATRMNEMETLFYSTRLGDELRESHGISVARGFGGKYKSRGGNCYVLMEDIGVRATFTTEQDPVSEMARAIAMVQTIGRLHGSLFNARTRFDTDLSWIIRQNDPLLGMTSEFFKQGWTTFVKRLGDRIPEEVKQRGQLLGPVAQQLHDFMGLPPFTLVHGDCHLENSYFVDGTNELGFYDMQLMRVAKGALDLATFMGGSFTETLLSGGASNDDGEKKLLQAYLTSLKESAGTLFYQNAFGKTVEYDLEALHRDYKMGLALAFTWNVAAALAVPFDTSAHLDYDEYATRLVATVHRTSAINYALFYLSVPGVCERFGLRGGSPNLGGLGTPAIQRVILGRATNVEYNVRLHRAVISPENGRGLFDSYVKRPLKYKFIHRMTSSRKGHHGQNTTDMAHEELEGHHSVSFAEGKPMQNYAIDSYYLSAFSPTSPSVALRWCRRFNEEMGEVWLVVKMPTIGGGVWTWADHPFTTTRCYEEGEDTVVVQGKDGSTMKFTCIEAMKVWRAVFKGRLRNQATGDMAPVTFDLVTEACHPHFAFASSVSPALVAEALANEPFSRELFDELKATHQEHYEQFCQVRGNLSLGKQDFKVDAKGMRDRAFGARQWAYLQRYVASYFWMGDKVGGSSVSIAFASLPTLTAGKFGFVTMKDGEAPLSIDAISGTLAEIAPDGTPPQEWELSFRCGKTYFLCRAFAMPDDSVGLNMQNEMWIHLRFARFEVSFVDPDTLELKQLQGFGGSEFGYRYEGVQPYRPKKADAAPVFGKHD